MKKSNRVSFGVGLAMATMAIGAVSSPLRAQGAGLVHIANEGYCVNDETGWQPGVSISAACEVVPGVNASASASAVAGRLGIATDIRGSMPGDNEYPSVAAQAEWRDQLRWSDPSVSTIVFTVALHGSTFASYNDVGPSGAYGDGSFSVDLYGLLPVTDQVNFREGVGEGRPPGVPVDVLSHSTPYSITRAYPVLVGGLSGITMYLSLALDDELIPGYTDGYTGEAGSDFAHTAEFSGLAFLDDAGSP